MGSSLYRSSAGGLFVKHARQCSDDVADQGPLRNGCLSVSAVLAGVLIAERRAGSFGTSVHAAASSASHSRRAAARAGAGARTTAWTFKHWPSVAFVVNHVAPMRLLCSVWYQWPGRLRHILLAATRLHFEPRA